MHIAYVSKVNKTCVHNAYHFSMPACVPSFIATVSAIKAVGTATLRSHTMKLFFFKCFEYISVKSLYYSWGPQKVYQRCKGFSEFYDLHGGPPPR